MKISYARRKDCCNPAHLSNPDFSSNTVRAKYIALAFFASGALSSHVLAQNTPAARIDVSDFPAQMVEEVVVPVPSEVFTVLNKLGAPDWNSELRPMESIELGDRPHIALLLGTVIADGFLSVQAEDSERVKDVGREVLRLAGAIGVRDSVVRRSKSIIEAADTRDWQVVKVELDKALQDVRGAMIELNDEELAQLVSLGGWLRGTETLTSIVRKTFSEDASELLHQPLLVEYFERRLGGLSEPLSSNELVHDIRAGLDEIRPHIMIDENQAISAEAVENIHATTSRLINRITRRS
ncbi:MAG: hypothetical protein ACFCU3_07325 [Verrucomicrobiales bacterium]